MGRREPTIAFRRVLNALPRSELLFKLSRLYVNFYSGQDDPDFRTNGEEQTLRRVLPGCAVVFDVGAHVGEWTALALEINPSLEVHCFEPAAATFGQLERRHGRNPGVRLNHVALSSAAGEASLHIREGESDRSSLHGADGSTEAVRLRTLDEYCDAEGVARVDYLKIDVEGHEHAVLQGSGRMLREGRVRYVQVEYGPGYLDAGTTLRDVVDLLGACGYRPQKILPRGLQPVPGYSRELENFTLSNWLFARG